MTLNRSKSLRLARFARRERFFAQDVASHFDCTSSFSHAALMTAAFGQRLMSTLRSVSDKRLKFIFMRQTPVMSDGPSMSALFWSMTSMIVHSLPSRGP